MNQMNKICWIHPNSFSPKQKQMVLQELRVNKFDTTQLMFMSSTEFHSKLPLIKATCKTIVVNCGEQLSLHNGDKSLDKYRGSTYICKFTNLPCVVFDDILIISFKPEGKFAFTCDTFKLQHIHTNGLQIPEQTILIAKTVADVRNGLQRLYDNSKFVAVDIETLGSPPFMTCIGIANHNFALVIPFFNPTEPLTRCWWVKETDEIEVFTVLKQFLESPIIKCFHNFSFDCPNILRYNIAVVY